MAAHLQPRGVRPEGRPRPVARKLRTGLARGPFQQHGVRITHQVADERGMRAVELPVGVETAIVRDFLGLLQEVGVEVAVEQTAVETRGLATGEMHLEVLGEHRRARDLGRRREVDLPEAADHDIAGDDAFAVDGGVLEQLRPAGKHRLAGELGVAADMRLAFDAGAVADPGQAADDGVVADLRRLADDGLAADASPTGDPGTIEDPRARGDVGRRLDLGGLGDEATTVGVRGAGHLRRGLGERRPGRSRADDGDRIGVATLDREARTKLLRDVLRGCRRHRQGDPLTGPDLQGHPAAPDRRTVTATAERIHRDQGRAPIPGLGRVDLAGEIHLDRLGPRGRLEPDDVHAILLGGLRMQRVPAPIPPLLQDGAQAGDPRGVALEPADLLEVKVLVLEIPADHAGGEFADGVAETFDAVFPDLALDADAHDRLERILQGAVAFIAAAGRPDVIGEGPTEARILGQHLQEGPGAVVVAAGVQLVMRPLGVMTEHRRVRRHELVRAPVGVAFPEPADQRRITEAFGVVLHRVRELMDDHATAVAQGARVHDHVGAAEGETLLVLGEARTRHEHVELMGRSVSGHRQRGAQLIQVGPDRLEPDLLALQEAGREGLLPRTGLVGARIEGEMRTHRDVRRLLRVPLHHQRVLGTGLRGNLLAALHLELFGEGPVGRGKQLGRITAQAVVIPQQDQRGG